MLISGNHYNLVKPFEPNYIPAQKIIKSSNNFRVVFDHGYTKDLRSAFIVLRGDSAYINTIYTSYFLGSTDVVLTCEDWEFPFGIEVDYSSALSVKTQGATVSNINFRQSELSFEAFLEGASLIAEKSTNIDNGCVQFEFNNSYINPRNFGNSKNNTVYINDTTIRTKTLSFTMIGNFSDMSKIKNYLVQDVRANSLLTVPSGLMLGGSIQGYVNSITENFIGINDIYLDIEMEIAS